MDAMSPSLNSPVAQSLTNSDSGSSNASNGGGAGVSVRRLRWLQARMFVLTFLSYALYSGTRQAFGVTKASLHPDYEKHPDATGWAPFDDRDWGSTYLGAVSQTANQEAELKAQVHVLIPLYLSLVL